MKSLSVLKRLLLTILLDLRSNINPSEEGFSFFIIFVLNQNIYKVDKTPEQLQEIFEFYSQWLLTDAESPQELIEWLCDNVKLKALETIVATYESNNN